MCGDDPCGKDKPESAAEEADAGDSSNAADVIGASSSAAEDAGGAGGVDGGGERKTNNTKVKKVKGMSTDLLRTKDGRKILKRFEGKEAHVFGHMLHSVLVAQSPMGQHAKDFNEGELLSDQMLGKLYERFVPR